MISEWANDLWGLLEVSLFKLICNITTTKPEEVSSSCSLEDCVCVKMYFILATYKFSIVIII
jgi:hypothetical protein